MKKKDLKIQVAALQEQLELARHDAANHIQKFEALQAHWVAERERHRKMGEAVAALFRGISACRHNRGLSERKHQLIKEYGLKI